MNASVLPLRTKFLSRWRRTAAIIFALLFLAFLSWRVSLHFEVKSKINAIKLAGLPTSGSELNGWISSVRPENGALVLTQAFALTKTSQGALTASERPRLIATNTWSQEVRTGVQGYLLTNTSAIEEIDRALGFASFRFPVDYTAGFATELPHLRLSKESAVLLSLRTALAAEEGSEWSHFLERQIQFGEALNEEPTVMGFLVRCACLQIAVNTAERSLRYAPLGVDAYQRLSAALLRAAETNLLPRALITERAMTLAFFSTMPHFSDSRDEDAEEVPHSATTTPGGYNQFFRATGFFERDLNFYLGSMAEAIDLARQPPPENLTLTNLFENIEKEARAHFYIYSSMFLPALSRVATRQATIQAKLRMAAVAFALEAFRQTNGKLPDNLEQLTSHFLKTVPTDPFVGKPLRYSLIPGGYLLYSLGPDGVDNGGVPEPKQRRRQASSPFDLTFKVTQIDQP